MRNLATVIAILAAMSLGPALAFSQIPDTVTETQKISKEEWTVDDQVSTRLTARGLHLMVSGTQYIHYLTFSRYFGIWFQSEMDGITTSSAFGLDLTAMVYIWQSVPLVCEVTQDSSLTGDCQLITGIISTDAATMAIEGDWLAVGRPEASDPGLANLYHADVNGDFSYVQTVSQGSSPGLHFGASLALDPDTGTLVVGMPRPGSGSYGIVYHYQLSGTTWVLHNFFAAPGSPADDGFGSAVAVSGQWLAVGAPGTNSDAGAVHVYELVSGSYVYRDTLQGSAQSGARFGESVALQGLALVAGAPGEDLDVPPFPVVDMGAAYVYWRTAGVWNGMARLQASDGSALDAFGASVGLSDAGALVGAPMADYDPLDDAGAIYSFADWNPIFVDGFESGGVTSWSTSVP